MNNNKNLLVIILVIFMISILFTGACSPKEPDPSLAGTWWDPGDEETFFKIFWAKDKYYVSVIWKGDSYTPATQEWSKDKLTWTYFDREISDNTISTYVTGPYTNEYIIATKTIGKRESTVQLFRVEEVSEE